MCGLWASFGFSVDRTAIDNIDHRGPDGEGWENLSTPIGPLTLGSKRLAIIDRSEAGKQPMKSLERNIWIVYNGEIYNHSRLRDELKLAGYKFKGRSDTEVILNSYLYWGKDCLSHFNGMFSFVIWNGENNHLFVVRDRFGIKPLYYYVSQKGIAFASEIKQFAGIQGFQYKASTQVALDFLAIGLTDHGPQTIFSDVLQLLGGEYLSLDMNSYNPGDALDINRWYNYHSNQPNVHTTNEQAVDRFRTLLDESVREHLVSDVEVGSCLSGGIDSSSIVGFASKYNPSLHTISAFFDDAKIDERKFAISVAEHTNTRLTHVTPSSSELLDQMDAMHFAQDSPVSSSSVFAQWAVFRKASELGIKVMLDGQGADEQLGGYEDSVIAHQAGLIRKLDLFGLIDGLYLRPLGMNPVTALLRSSLSALPIPIQRVVYKRRSSEKLNWLRKGFLNDYAPKLPPRESLTALGMDHFHRSSLPALLRYEDRNSMAHGIEARVPFLDHRIYEFLSKQPDDLKIFSGTTKWLLRKSVEDLLPKNIVWRQDKIGFVTPQEKWLSENRHGLLKDSIDDVSSRFPTIFNERKLISMTENLNIHHHALWRVCSFSSWSRVFEVVL